MSSEQRTYSTEAPADASGVFPIWPDGPPGSDELTGGEQIMQRPNSPQPTRMVRNVTVPTLTVFEPPAGTANGKAMVVAPGGAFHLLMIDYEGYDIARWLNGLGYTAFVLKYRILPTPTDDADMPAFLEKMRAGLPKPSRDTVDPPVGHKAIDRARPWAEEDGRQAVRFVRSNAQRWQLDPDRIGIIGFSAGGAVVVNTALEHDGDSRPDFAAGIYPAYRPGPAVPDDAPPLFIVTADDDSLVAPMSSSRLYEMWHKAGKPVEFHVFANGEHGFGMKRLGLHPDIWPELLRTWLARFG